MRKEKQLLKQKVTIVITYVDQQGDLHVALAHKGKSLTKTSHVWRFPEGEMKPSEQPLDVFATQLGIKEDAEQFHKVGEPETVNLADGSSFQRQHYQLNLGQHDNDKGAKKKLKSLISAEAKDSKTTKDSFELDNLQFVKAKDLPKEGGYKFGQPSRGVRQNNLNTIRKLNTDHQKSVQTQQQQQQQTQTPNSQTQQPAVQNPATETTQTKQSDPIELNPRPNRTNFLRQQKQAFAKMLNDTTESSLVLAFSHIAASVDQFDFRGKAERQEYLLIAARAVTFAFSEHKENPKTLYIAPPTQEPEKNWPENIKTHFLPGEQATKSNLNGRLKVLPEGDIRELAKSQPIDFKWLGLSRPEVPQEEPPTIFADALSEAPHLTRHSLHQQSPIVKNVDEGDSNSKTDIPESTASNKFNSNSKGKENAAEGSKGSKKPKPNSAESSNDTPALNAPFPWVVVETSGSRVKNCLGAAIGEVLTVLSQQGKPAWNAHLNDMDRFKPLFAVLATQHPEVSQLYTEQTGAVSKHVNTNRVRGFAALSALPTQERQARLGAAMRSLLSDIFNPPEGADPESDAVKIVLSGYFENSLLNDFDKFFALSVAEESSFQFSDALNGFTGAPLNLLAKFKEIKAAKKGRVVEKEVIVSWWRETGRSLYGQVIAKPGSDLTYMHGALLAAKFGLRFQCVSPAQAGISIVENGIINDLPAIILHNTDEPAHWSAYLPLNMVMKYNAKKAESHQLKHTFSHPQKPKNDVLSKDPSKKKKKKNPEDVPPETPNDKKEDGVSVNVPHGIGGKDFYKNIEEFFSKSHESDNTDDALPEYAKCFGDTEENPYKKDSKVLQSKNGVELAFSDIQSPDKDPQSKRLCITATKYIKPESVVAALSEDQIKAEKLNSIVNAFAAAFQANGLKLHIEIHKIGDSWPDKQQVADAFKAAGFKRIVIQGKEFYNVEKKDNSIEASAAPTPEPDPVRKKQAWRDVKSFSDFASNMVTAGKTVVKGVNSHGLGLFSSKESPQKPPARPTSEESDSNGPPQQPVDPVTKNDGDDGNPVTTTATTLQ